MNAVHLYRIEWLAISYLVPGLGIKVINHLQFTTLIELHVEWSLNNGTEGLTACSENNAS
jgi:hypothetical protein